MAAQSLGQFKEDMRLSFAIWCDESGLPLAGGIEAAEDIGAELVSTAEDRASFLGDEEGEDE